MADWQERVQSLIIGFVFGFMVVKLFSVISSFRAGNLRVARGSDVDDVLLVPAEELGPGGEELSAPLLATDEETEADGGDELEDRADGDSSTSSDSEAEDEAAAAASSREFHAAGTDEPTVSGGESKGGEASKDEEVEAKKDGEGGDDAEGVGKTESKAPDDNLLKALSEEEADGVDGEEFEEEDGTDDWEGVESTELEKLFGAASSYADTLVALPGVTSSSEAMLQLHALYKIATEGPCSSSQPSAFQPTARAKWNAWQKLGSMHQDVAMQKYVDTLTEINPTWYEDYRKSKEPAKETAEQKNASSWLRGSPT